MNRATSWNVGFLLVQLREAIHVQRHWQCLRAGSRLTCLV